MSEVTMLEGEEEQENIRQLKPEDTDAGVIFHEIKEVQIKEKKLSFEEASMSLCHLGKDESGIRYAYLMIDIRDRKFTDISAVLNFKHVLFLDVSGNFLTLDALQVLVDMPFLVFLKAERNRIESAALGIMPYLQVLCLNRNQITETCDINQPMLDSLELHYNMIYMAQFDVERLKSLKQLELRGNHLIDISGSYPRNIEKLYLADNKICFINPDDISHLTNLEILHLRDNSIKKLKGFTESLENLTYLNLRNNNISKMREFKKLQCLKNLETLIITGNPVFPEVKPGPEDKGGVEDEEMGEGEENFSIPVDPRRIALLVLLPNLKRINKEFVKESERVLMMEVRDEKYKEIMAEQSSDEDLATPTDMTTDIRITDTEEEEDEGESEVEFDKTHEEESEEEDEGASEEEYE